MVICELQRYAVSLACAGLPSIKGKSLNLQLSTKTTDRITKSAMLINILTICKYMFNKQITGSATVCVYVTKIKILKLSPPQKRHK